MSSSGHITDDALLNLIVAGDPSALQSLYDRHGRTLYSLALRIMGDSQSAQEVLRDTFLQLWAKSLKFDSERGSLLAWLLTITRHRALGRIREQRTRVSGESFADRNLFLNSYPGSSSLDLNISRGLVSKAFAKLSEAQRAAIDLSYFDGLSYEEIAARRQAPLGTAKKDLRSGLTKLKKILRNQASAEVGNPHSSHVDLKDILITEQLSSRDLRLRDPLQETKALDKLAEVMANAPNQLLDSFLQMPLDLCGADTSGLSLLETNSTGEEIFRWTNLRGTLAKYVGGSTPRNFSPCGVTLDYDAPQLFDRPSRYFSYFNQVEVPIVEGLVIPFHIGSKTNGTIWIVSHSEGTKFDSEDARIMTSVAEFAGCALHLHKYLSEKES